VSRPDSPRILPRPSPLQRSATTGQKQGKDSEYKHDRDLSPQSLECIGGISAPGLQNVSRPNSQLHRSHVHGAKNAQLLDKNRAISSHSITKSRGIMARMRWWWLGIGSKDVQRPNSPKSSAPPSLPHSSPAKMSEF
jgi:hypothetical protein